MEAETRIVDSDGLLDAAFPEFSLVNPDMTVNLDLEGIAVSSKGGFWVINEGRGTVGDEDRPVESNNCIIKVAVDGTVEEVIKLPAEIDAIQFRFGFEGVAEQGDFLIVVFQRAWSDSENPRIGIYHTVDMTWKFVFYPLDEPLSPNGGWVGLSDISPLGYGEFMVVERDNQGSWQIIKLTDTHCVCRNEMIVW